jgi:TRAP-type C4-dicarboxylate transport system permease small subunit
LSDPERRLLISILACVLFGYAAVSCLVFYRRMRRQMSEYRNAPLERMVHSPQYGLTMWFTGVIGVIGFVIASWQLVLSMLAILRGN